MLISIIFILSVSLSMRETSAQMPNYFPSGSPSSLPSIPGPNSWQSSGFSSGGSSQYQPYRAPSIPQQTSPQLSTISQLSGYSRLSAAAPQSTPWTQYQGNGPRSWSVPSPVRSYPTISQPQSNGLSGYSRPATLSSPSSAPTPSQVQGTPFQSSWSINHQAASPAQPSPVPAAQPQSYNFPAPAASPPTQSWSQPSAPTRWSPPPTQPYRTLQPAPVTQWRPQPTQNYGAPQPAPVAQWSPPAQTQSPSAVLPTPPAQAPTTYQSPQNAQNQRPAPVHYANIGPQLQGDYKFGYHTGDGGSFREETRLPDGTVQGAYGFIDADGKQRIVRYRAGKDGFQAEGDDVPKGSPVSADSSSPQSQPASAPINVDEGAAFRSFSQG